MEGILSNLGIDWKLLLAQVVNFAVLFLVLNKFVFTPLLKLIEERQKKIQEIELKELQAKETLEEAERKKEEEIKKAQEEAKRVLKEAEEIAQKIKAKAKNEAEVLTKEILKKAEAEAKKKREEILNLTKKEILETALLLAEKIIALSPNSLEELRVKENLEKFKDKLKWKI